MANRTKLTDDRAAAFLQAVELGAPIHLAAQAAGWSESGAYAYLADGRAARDLANTGQKLTAAQRRKMELVEAYEKAEGIMVRNSLAAIVRAAQRPQHWTAAAWLLERRFPETYGRRMVEVVGKDGGPIEVDVQASELLAELRALSGGEPRTTNGAVYDSPRTTNGALTAPEPAELEAEVLPDDERG